MLLTQIKQDLVTAVKARDTLRATVLRFLLSEIRNREIETGKMLDDQQAINVLRKEVKRRHEAFEVYHKAHRADLADQELAEEKILQAYLPCQNAS